MAAAVIRVWDPLVRFVHWSVALLVVIDLLNEAGANPWHRDLGYAAGALVALRLVWGIFGSHHARLASMAASARRLPAYVRKSMSGRRRFYAGHNPLGAWMAFALWGLVLAVVITGWMLQLDTFWGDESLQALHAAAAYGLATCIVVHVTGAIITSVVSRTNLVKTMITGNKLDKNA
ncbi:MAG: cytochrome b/b6 domain-containing protein [Burkholderiales bacterium]